IPARVIAMHTVETLAYLLAGLFLMPRLLRYINSAKWNPLVAASPVGYICLILLAYTALAAALDVSFVFAAFLTGFALAQATNSLQSAFETVGRTSFAVFIPIYFALVGCRLDLGHSFSVTLLLVFLTIACTVKLLSA